MCPVAFPEVLSSAMDLAELNANKARTNYCLRITSRLSARLDLTQRPDKLRSRPIDLNFRKPSSVLLNPIGTGVYWILRISFPGIQCFACGNKFDRRPRLFSPQAKAVSRDASRQAKMADPGCEK